MSDIKSFINEFIQRKGNILLFSTFITKGLGFILNLAIIYILLKSDYGEVTYSYTIVSFVMPFMGLGLFHSYLKFAPLLPSQTAKIKMFRHNVLWGTLLSFLMALILSSLAGFITQKQPGAYYYSISFSFLIVSLFLFESVKNYFRVFLINKAFAQLEILNAACIFISAITLSLLFGAKGYIFALVFTPFAIAIYMIFKHKMLRNVHINLRLDKKRIWSYGIFTGAGTVISTLIYSVDILSIGNIIKDSSELIAEYKAMSLIPLNLMILPTIVLKTDFVKLVKEAQNKSYLINYAKNFVRIFLTIGISIAVLVGLFHHQIAYIFGSEYLHQSHLLVIFSVGIVGAYTLRIPFSNILSAVGWAKINSIISLTTLIADIILNYILILKFGITGAAYATAILLWCSGMLSASAFYIYIKRLK